MSESAAILLDNPSPRPQRGTEAGWLLLFLMSFVLYTMTANRGAQWQDSGDISLRIYQGRLMNELGLALTHPLHFALGRLVLHVPRLEPVFAVTLISSLCGALTVANVFGCVRALVGRSGPAWFVAVSLALANTFWHFATLTEVSTLTTALLSAECWCLIRFAQQPAPRVLWGMLLLNGLGIANHLQAVLTTPVLAVVIVYCLLKGRIRWSDACVGALLWMLGAMPYVALVVSQIVRTRAVASTLHSALFGTTFASNVLNTGISLRMLGVSAAFILFNFPNLLLPAAGYGMLTARRAGIPTLLRRALLAELLIHALFVLRYNVSDQYTFFLPMYTLLCLFAGIGAAEFTSVRTGVSRAITGIAVLLLLITPVTYWVATSAARHYDVLRGMRYHKPYRDDYTYLFIPWSIADRSADLLSKKAVELAAPDGLVLVEDSMARFAVQYRAEREGMPNVTISVWPGAASPQACAALMLRAQATFEVGSPVVFVPLDAEQYPQLMLPSGEWKRDGDLYYLDTGEDSSAMDSFRS